MKKLLILLTIFALIFMGCEEVPDNKSNSNTTLTIKNESSHIISTLRWNNQLFAVQPIVLLPGGNTTEYVNHGSGRITFAFFRPDTGFADMGVFTYDFRTQDILVIEEGEESEFTFTNNTILVDEDGENGVLSIQAKKIASLKIGNETSYRLSGISWNNYNYTTSPNGSYLEPGTDASRRWSNLHFSGANLPIKININSTTYVTDEKISLGKWDQKEFVFKTNTIVVDQNDNKSTLGSLF